MHVGWVEGVTVNTSEYASDLARQCVIDVADKAQREMIILRVDPARSRQAAPHNGKRLADRRRDFNSGEQAGHDNLRTGGNEASGRLRRLRRLCRPVICNTLRMGGSLRVRNPSGLFLCPNAGNELLDFRQNPANDDADARRIRMQPIRQSQRPVSGNAIEKERVERHAILCRQFGDRAG